MKKKQTKNKVYILLCTMFFLFTFNTCFCQKTIDKCEDVRESEKPPDVCSIVADDNGYLLGTYKFEEFVSKNIHLTDADRHKGEEKCILIYVYIDRDGRPTGYKIYWEGENCKKCTAAALAVIKKIKKWKSGSGKISYLIRVSI